MKTTRRKNEYVKRRGLVELTRVMYKRYGDFPEDIWVWLRYVRKIRSRRFRQRAVTMGLSFRKSQRAINKEDED